MVWVKNAHGQAIHIALCFLCDVSLRIFFAATVSRCSVCTPQASLRDVGHFETDDGELHRERIQKGKNADEQGRHNVPTEHSFSKKYEELTPELIHLQSSNNQHEPKSEFNPLLSPSKFEDTKDHMFRDCFGQTFSPINSLEPGSSSYPASPFSGPLDVIPEEIASPNQSHTKVSVSFKASNPLLPVPLHQEQVPFVFKGGDDYGPDKRKTIISDVPDSSREEEGLDYLELANDLQKSGHLESSLEYYDKGLKQATNRILRSALFFNRSVAHARLGSWGKVKTIR